MHDPAVDARLATCERQIRALRRALGFTTGLLACGGALAVTGFAGRGSAAPSESPTSTDSLRVRELIVVDDSGTVRARVGGNLPDAIYHGRRMRRGDQAAGVLLYDKNGLERGGYVTFDRSGVVALTLDNRGQQVAIFGADSAPGAGATARPMARKRLGRDEGRSSRPTFLGGAQRDSSLRAASVNRCRRSGDVHGAKGRIRPDQTGSFHECRA